MSTTLTRPAQRTGYAHSLIDPALFDFWAGQFNPLWTWARPLARIVERRAASEGAVTLVLKPNRHVGPVQPGQHLQVGAEIDGHRVNRSYSLSRLPGADGLLSITVQAVDQGRLSTHLCQHARVGDLLSVGAAFGDMTVPAQPNGRWLLLAAGSGVTPFLSLVPALLQHPQAEVQLVVWARQRDRLIEADALRALARQHPRFKLHFVLTREAALAEGESAGRLSAETLPALLGDAGSAEALAETRVMACGPGDFVANARALLDGRVAGLQSEAFSLPASAMTDAADALPVQLTLRRSGQTLTVPGGQSLLTALEAQGFKPPSGCRMGICHTCVCTRVEGMTQDLVNGQRDAEPQAALRLCVSRPCTDLTIDL
ncbi:ferredoxin reductase [Ideonella azotifigens]|uniref:Ferredoxin reductase n=3 Tax=Ideonella azotifigens TaxID=513160 RepID=A0ABN1K1P9_9BURK|nr:ferredoxin reductase [Ideonella azotifigens]MCD2341638.1 ferredoxin reductase [Ideonella azotifigens]